jgi:hypothetical protein
LDGKLSSVVGIIIILAAVMRISGPAMSPAPGGDSGNHLSTPAHTAQAGPQEDKETELVPQSDRGPWYATCQFFSPDLSSVKPPAESVPLASRATGVPYSPAAKWCLPKEVVQYHFLFATVPDPVDTHLALDFDRRMEAILDASQASGFSYDRYWLPWEAAYAPSEDDSKGHQKVVRQLRSEQPGLLLFRKNNPTGGYEILLVFLIGETPTAGIHRLQFANAMRYMGDIDSGQYPNDPGFTHPKSVRVLGPSFSGSAYSLRKFLEQFHCPQCFHLVSSSATNPPSLELLRSSPVIDLKQVMHDDNWALGHFLQFVEQDLHFKLKDVALLAEDATDYGHVSDNSGPTTAGKDPCETGKSRAPKDCAVDVCCLQHVLTVAFPREIAQLRNAYPESQPTPSAGKDAPAPQQQGLTLTLKGSATSQDDVPPFSGSQLPLSQEAVLLNITSTLRREQIRIVGILATDIFDTLFLSRFLRSSCPDIRIFVVQSDLLMVRAAEDIPLDGVLAITTYPLIGGNQYWTAHGHSARHRNLWASAAAQSTYNATVVLLRDIPQTLSPHPLEYSSPFDPSEPRPPLWLTVIGHDAYWPLALLDETEKTPGGKTRDDQHLAKLWPDDTAKADTNSQGVCQEPGEPFECEPPPALWSLVLGVLCCWVALYLIAVWFAWFVQNSKRYFWLENFALKDGEANARTTERAFYLLMEALVLTALVLIAVSPAWKLFELEPSPYVRWYSAVLILSYVSVVLMIALVLTAVYLTGVFLRTRPSDRVSHRTAWVFIGWTLFVVLSLSWLSFCYRHSPTPAFFAYRALDLASGASPATPFVFLLLGFYAWARVHMHRLRYSETRRPALPALGIASVVDGKRIDECFERAIRELYDRRLFLFNLTVFVLAFFLAHPIRYLRTLEGRWFDALYIFCFALLYFAICSNWIRFLLGWSFLRQFLRRLEDQPFRLAFSRLSKELSWGPIWKQGGTRRTYLLFTRSGDYLRALLNSLPSQCVLPEFREKCASVRLQTADLLDNAAGDHWDDASKICDLQRLLASCAQDLVPPLEHRWSQGTTDLVEEATPCKEGDASPDPDLSAHLAEEFLAVRCLAFMRYASLQLRNLLGFLSTAFILSVISLHAYPFQAPHNIGWTMTAVFVVLGSGVVLVFVQMDKDAILSRLSRTNPGELDRQFILRLISFGALPLLTVLASQFPSIGRFLFSWVQPGLEALR